VSCWSRPCDRSPRPIGVLTVYTHNPCTFSEKEEELVIALGELCALAIPNSKVYQTIKRRYEDVVDEVQQWFEHSQTFPLHSIKHRLMTIRGRVRICDIQILRLDNWRFGARGCIL
jgi:GAF domain-containing protein